MLRGKATQAWEMFGVLRFSQAMCVRRVCYVQARAVFGVERSQEQGGGGREVNDMWCFAREATTPLAWRWSRARRSPSTTAARHSCALRHEMFCSTMARTEHGSCKCHIVAVVTAIVVVVKEMFGLVAAVVRADGRTEKPIAHRNWPDLLT